MFKSLYHEKKQENFPVANWYDFHGKILENYEMRDQKAEHRKGDVIKF